MERGRIQGLPKIFQYPLLPQGRVKLRTSYPLLSQERIMLRTSNLACIFTGFIRTKVLKILGKMECGRIQGLAKFF